MLIGAAEFDIHPMVGFSVVGAGKLFAPPVVVRSPAAIFAPGDHMDDDFRGFQARPAFLALVKKVAPLIGWTPLLMPASTVARFASAYAVRAESMALSVK